MLQQAWALPAGGRSARLAGPAARC